MTLSNLEVRVRLIEAKTAQLEAQKTQRAISGIGRSSKAAGKQAAESSAGFDKMTAGAHRLRSALTFAAGAVGFGAVFYGIKGVIAAGTAWQNQQAQLQNALRNTGHAGAGAMDTLNAAIAGTSTKGGFSPAEEAQGLANFIRLTGSASSATKLNAEAINLARGAHLGYQQALRMVSQIQTGQVGRLQKYIGIVIPVTTHVNALTAAQKRLYPQLYQQAKIADKLATAQKANALIMDRYRGSTEAYSRTAAGAISNAQNTFALLTEQIARTVLPIITKVGIFLGQVALTILHNWPAIKSTISAAFSPLLSVIRWLGGVKTVLIGIGVAFAVFQAAKAILLGIAFASKVAATWTALMAGAEALATASTTGLTVAMAALGIVMDTMGPMIFVTAIIAIGVALYEAYKHCKVFRDIVNDVFRGFKVIIGTTVSFVKAAWPTVFSILSWPFTRLPQYVAGIFNQVVGFVTSLPGKIARAAVGLWNGLKSDLRAVLNWIIRLLDSIQLPSVSIPFIGKIGGGHLFHIGQIGGAGGAGSSSSQANTTNAVVRHLAAASAAHGAPGASGAGAMAIHPGVTQVLLNGRVLAEATTHYTLQRYATR